MLDHLEWYPYVLSDMVNMRYYGFLEPVYFGEPPILICSQPLEIMVEEGYAWPGTLAVASDSHSNHYGGVGCLGTIS